MDGRILTCVYCGHEYPQGTPAAGWRDVADELPQEAQEVLFVRGGKTVHGAWIGGIFWHSNQKMAAAYWMPLPLPPNLALTKIVPQDVAEMLSGEGPDPELRHMGPAQKLVLLDQVLDSITQRLADQFGVDAKSMAMALSRTQNRWVMSVGTDFPLR
jgi:hypothetical protein